jgi:hypothetical protein
MEMKVQFVDRKNPLGPPLYEAEVPQVPKMGEYVRLPDLPQKVVESVHWVIEDGGVWGVAVVLG